MSSFYQILASLCLFTLAGLVPSKAQRELPMRVGKPLFIALNQQSPSLAAFNDSRMDLSQSHKGQESVFGHHAHQEVELKAGHVSFVGEKHHDLIVERRPQIRLNGMTIRLASEKVRLVPEKVHFAHHKSVLLKNHEDSVGNHIEDSMGNHIEDSVGNHIEDSAGNHIEDSVGKHIIAKVSTQRAHKKATLYELSGSIEMMEGLALTGTDTHLSVGRVFRRHLMDEGEILLEDGVYKLIVSDLKGHIVAKLSNTEGRILGIGEFNLYQLPKEARKLIQINELHIKIKPYNPSLVASLLRSGLSFSGHQIPVDRGRVFFGALPSKKLKNKASKGLFVDNSFLPYSSFMMRAEEDTMRDGEEKKHRGSLALGVSGRQNLMRIYPQSMVGALLEIQGMNADSSSPIIWGRVTQEGQPVKGAQVELAGDMGLRPIYFNAYIPDSQLKSTQTDGLFAFVGLDSGLQAVRVTLDEKYVSTQVTLTQEEYVSYLDIAVAPVRSASVEVYDGQADQSLSADIQVYGTGKIIEIDGSKDEAMYFPGGPGVMILEVDPGDEYLFSRHSVHRSQKSIELPAVRQDWWRRVKFQLAREEAGGKVFFGGGLEEESALNHSHIIGYVNGSDYDIIFDQAAGMDSDSDMDLDHREIVYFDKDGKIIYSSTKHGSGQGGGGFIIFNVPKGLHSVTIVPSNSSISISNVSMASANYSENDSESDPEGSGGSGESGLENDHISSEEIWKSQKMFTQVLAVDSSIVNVMSVDF